MSGYRGRGGAHHVYAPPPLPSPQPQYAPPPHFGLPMQFGQPPQHYNPPFNAAPHRGGGHRGRGRGGYDGRGGGRGRGFGHRGGHKRGYGEFNRDGDGSGDQSSQGGDRRRGLRWLSSSALSDPWLSLMSAEERLRIGSCAPALSPPAPSSDSIPPPSPSPSSALFETPASIGAGERNVDEIALDDLVADDDGDFGSDEMSDANANANADEIDLGD